MSLLPEYLTRSGAVRTFAIAGAVMTATAMGAASFFDKVASGALPSVALIGSDGTVTLFGGAAGKLASRFDPKQIDKQIDMTPIGAINRTTVDPCTGKPK